VRIAHYSVFAAAPGGGKQCSIVEGVSDPQQMQQIAAQSSQPLTGFILNAGTGCVEARFFSPTKEKGSSDSGALVVGEHLRRQGAIQDRVRVQMGQEELEVSYQDGKWWSEQPETTVYPFAEGLEELLRILGILEDYTYSKEFCAYSGTHQKKNVIIGFDYSAWSTYKLDEIKPHLDWLASYNTRTNTNGLIILYGSDLWAELRFFAPAKGINEDNAGSFTLASVCAYASQVWGVTGHSNFRVVQGQAMGKPSELFATFIAENGSARNIMVGGKVETL